MGNKIDDFLRRSYQKQVPYKDAYWREMEVLLGPSPKDRRLVWALIFLCLALGTYIVFDHVQDSKRQTIAAETHGSYTMDEEATLSTSNQNSSSFIEQETEEQLPELVVIQNTSESISTTSVDISQKNLFVQDKNILLNRQTSSDLGTEVLDRSSEERAELNQISVTHLHSMSQLLNSNNLSDQPSTPYEEDNQEVSDAGLNVQESSRIRFGQDMSLLKGISHLLVWDGAELMMNPQELYSIDVSPKVQKAQNPKIGLVAGTQLYPYDDPGSRYITGFVGGAFVEKNLTNRLFLASGLQYQLRQGNFTSVDEVSNFSTSGLALETDEYTLTPSSLHYLRMPLTLGLRMNNFSISVGGSASYLMSVYGYSSVVNSIASEVNSGRTMPEVVERGFIDKKEMNDIYLELIARGTYDLGIMRVYSQVNQGLNGYSSETPQALLLAENRTTQLEFGIELELK